MTPAEPSLASSPPSLSSSESDQPLSRRDVLDEAKRTTILTLVANGSSRRIAARVVGCAPSTITRTAARDPEFAQRLARAEQNVEIEALRRLRNTARQDRYWRASAWLLERKNPDDFAARPPGTCSPEGVVRLLTELTIILAGSVPEENCRRAIDRLDQLLVQFGHPQRPKLDDESAELIDELQVHGDPTTDSDSELSPPQIVSPLPGTDAKRWSAGEESEVRAVD
jgi:hypothetical protein